MSRPAKRVVSAAAIHDMSALGLVGPWYVVVSAIFSRCFHPSPSLLPRPPISRGSHIFPTTSAKVFISSGDDVRVGEAPLFTARASPFLSSYAANPFFLPTPPHQPVGFAFRTERRMAARGREKGGKKRGEERASSTRYTCMCCEIKVYYRGPANATTRRYTLDA